MGVPKMGEIGKIFESLFTETEVVESTKDLKEAEELESEALSSEVEPSEIDGGEPIEEDDGWKADLRKRLDIAFKLVNERGELEEGGTDKKKRLLVGVDCSASMGYRQFYPLFEEIEKYVEDRELSVRCDLVAWADKGNRAAKIIPNIGKDFSEKVRAVTNSVNSGFTEFSSCLDTIFEQVKSPLSIDYFLFLTDGAFTDEGPNSFQRKFMRRIRGKSLWVLDLEGRLSIADPIGEWDSMFRRHYIILKRD